LKYKLETLTVALVSLLAIIPTVLAPSASVQGSVTVESTCDIAASPNVQFEPLVPSQTSTDHTTTVSEPTGNIVLTPTILGSAWIGTGETPPTMPVGQTHWANSDLAYASMTPLDTSVASINDAIGPEDNATVHFKLQVPNGQTADIYTQTITFEITC